MAVWVKARALEKRELGSSESRDRPNEAKAMFVANADVASDNGEFAGTFPLSGSRSSR
jgi:hypothetical protein